MVLADGSSSTGFSYHAGFLEPGDYTLAFVCAGGISPDNGITFNEPADDPDQNDALSFTLAGQSATVVHNQIEQIDF